jgi:hypothetical protein
MGIKRPKLTLANYTYSLPTSTVVRNLPLRSPHTFITPCLRTDVSQALSLFGQDPAWGPIKCNNVYNTKGACGSVVVEALCYKPEDRGIAFR